MKPAAVGWQPDPTGRYEYRFWDGQRWCADVFDDGLMFRDPFHLGADLPSPRGVTARRWGPRLLGPGVLVAGVAASVAFAIVPVTGGGTQTADGDTPRGGGTPQEEPNTPINGSSTSSTTPGPALGGMTIPPPPAGAPPTAGPPPPPSGSSTTTSSRGGNAGESDEALIERIANGMVAAGGGTLPLDQAQCFAESLVDALGADRIRELGFDNGDVSAMGSGMANLTTDEQMQMAMAGMSCTPMPTG